ncbi:MAG: hypothetical protein WA063_02445, partial [Minisyncoccia bacterium]
CNIIAKLANFEGMDTGYYCEFGTSILIPRNNGNEDAYMIKDCLITCPKDELAEIKKTIEDVFLEKYKIKIKLALKENSQNCGSFYDPGAIDKIFT